MSERWVINASPVILLSKAGVMDRVAELCAELVIPAGVVEEVSVGARGDVARAWLMGPGRQFIRPAPVLVEAVRHLDLGIGEAQVIAWALNHAGFIAVQDDLDGRRAAVRLGVPILGSLGVAVRSEAPWVH